MHLCQIESAILMCGPFLPLVLQPNVTFQAGRYPFVPTMEGQDIIKNLLIISAALVVGGTIRNAERRWSDRLVSPTDALRLDAPERAQLAAELLGSLSGPFDPQA